MYDKEKIKVECLKAVEENKLTFFSDLVEFVEPALSTLYEWELEKSEDIKKAIAKNKIATKRKMRNKWQDSDNAALQLAAYKLMAEKEELEALTMSKVDQSHKFPDGVQLIFTKSEGCEPIDYETKLR